ncbi:MAG TPA: hypothetical protein VFY21_00710 [Xanthobacteraceae bacterium]|nr:hypothetical protein [Xanthobacteraceae bacterium]
MAYEPGRNLFNPLLVGAIAVIIALVAFLALRDGDTTQQAGIESPPAATSPGPSAPTTPDRAPKGSGNL